MNEKKCTYFVYVIDFRAFKETKTMKKNKTKNDYTENINFVFILHFKIKATYDFVLLKLKTRINGVTNFFVI